LAFETGGGVKITLSCAGPADVVMIDESRIRIMSDNLAFKENLKGKANAIWTRRNIQNSPKAFGGATDEPANNADDTRDGIVRGCVVFMPVKESCFATIILIACATFRASSDDARDCTQIAHAHFGTERTRLVEPPPHLWTRQFLYQIRGYYCPDLDQSRE
jgi:hypothetical protein